MQHRVNPDEVMVASLNRVNGILRVAVLEDDDRQPILEKEREAEERSLMGLGKVVNTGVTEILRLQRVYVALTSMDFEWGCHGTLVLKKGEEIVGEEVRDAAILAELAQNPNVWFLHKNFVIYKDRVSFPGDIMKKVCHFEIPCLPADFCHLETDQLRCQSILFANPSTLCDLYLKSRYFDNIDEKGTGTILVGVKP